MLIPLPAKLLRVSRTFIGKPCKAKLSLPSMQHESGVLTRLKHDHDLIGHECVAMFASLVNPTLTKAPGNVPRPNGWVVILFAAEAQGILLAYGHGLVPWGLP